MKFLKVTYIDTAGHGYISVSKKDFLALGGDPKKITKCSGHTQTRLYLEEDCDGSYFAELAKEKDVNLVIKSSYNPSFGITHNYVPELFDYKPTIGHIVSLSDDEKYQITEIKENGRIIVRHTFTGMKYGIGKHNPFAHIRGINLTV